MTLLHPDLATGEEPFLELLDVPSDAPDETIGTGWTVPHERALASAACGAVEFLSLVAFGLPWLRSALGGGHMVTAALAGAVSVSATLIALDGYALPVLSAARPPWRAIAAAAGCGGLACLAVLGATGAHEAWRVAGLWATIVFLLLACLRTALAPLVARQFRRGLLLFRVAVLSTSPQAAQLRAVLLGGRDAGLALCGPGNTAHVLEQWHSLARFCRACRVDALVLDAADATEAVRGALRIPAQIVCMTPPDQMVPHLPVPVLPVRHLGSQKLPGLGLVQAQGRVFTAPARTAKAAFDLAAGGLILLAILPVMGFLALAVRLDSNGPVLFRQPRIGADDRTFYVLKFRTMYHDRADMLAARQTERGDPRITRVGRLLRRLSLDELPQLLNVLRGEMSLVGPRPHAPHTSVDGCLLHYAVPGYALRHRVKPGITGWAQINGARGPLSTRQQLERRLRLDLDYIARWSLGLDLKILAMTLCREIFSPHAY